jgi:hypothetical protein
MSAEDRSADRVVHATDPHFWRVTLNPARLAGKRALGMANLVLRRRNHLRTDLAEAFAREIAARGTETVIVSGDLTTTALEEEFAAARAFLDMLASLGPRPLVIPGNHDVYTFSSARRRLFERFLGDYLPAPELPARILLPRGAPVVFYPGTGPNVITSRGRLDRAVIERTAALVADAPAGRPVLLVGHYPLLPRTEAYREAWSHRLPRARELRAALAATGRTLLCAAGHVHRFSLVRDPEHPSLLHLTTEPLFMRRAAHAGAFSVLRCSPAGFHVSRCSRRDGAWQEIPLPPFP